MNDVDLSLWAGFIYQGIEATALVNDALAAVGAPNLDLDATGFDIGAKISSGPLAW